MIRMNNSLAAMSNTNTKIPWDIFEGGILEIYSGSQPTANNIPATGVLLARAEHLQWELINETTIHNKTCEVGAINNGTARWYRILSWDGFYSMSGSCGTSGADLNMSNIKMTTEQPQYFFNFTITWERGFTNPNPKKTIALDVPNEGIYYE